MSAGSAADVLRPLLRDPDGQIRRQAARTLADLRAGDAQVFRELLEDEDARVRSEAALALGKLADPDAIAPQIGRAHV